MDALAVPRLEVTRTSKTFGPARVLQDAGLAVRPGQLHALVGQNGSGKSTLVKILTGYHAPDHGASIRVDGQELDLPVSWNEAHRAGISVVHQDFGLLDHLTVAENIGVGGFERTRLLHRVDWRAQRRVAAALLEQLQVEVAPNTLVGELSAAHRATVAIARAMRDLVPGNGLIILDESTRSLGREELQDFHAMLRRILDTGTSMLLVSHSIDEVLTYADRITVLRDGQVVGAGLAAGEQTEQGIAKMMLGKDVDRIDTSSCRQRMEAPRVTVTGIHGPGADGLSLTIDAGEIVGVTGLPGSGFESLPYLLTGATPAAGGTMSIGERSLDLSRNSVTDFLRAGVVLIPERRDRDGLAMELSVRDNISLPTLHRHGSRFWAGKRWQHTQATDAIAGLGIRPNAPMRLLHELSGGNQQKVLLAKWMTVGPALMVMHEPTQAVDVGARADILNAVNRAAADGMAVLLVSVQAADLAAVCDRVLVYRGPREFTELRSDDPDVILDAVYATAVEPAPARS